MEKHKRIVRLAIEAIAILSLGFSAFAIENVDLEMKSID